MLTRNRLNLTRTKTKSQAISTLPFPEAKINPFWRNIQSLVYFFNPSFFFKSLAFNQKLPGILEDKINWPKTKGTYLQKNQILELADVDYWRKKLLNIEKKMLKKTDDRMDNYIWEL